MIQRMNILICEYQELCFKVISSYSSERGMWGSLAEMYSTKTIRSVFICRSSNVFHFVHRRKGIVVAYAELRKLLNHSVAQELELMTETI